MSFIHYSFHSFFVNVLSQSRNLKQDKVCHYSWNLRQHQSLLFQNEIRSDMFLRYDKWVYATLPNPSSTKPGNRRIWQTNWNSMSANPEGQTGVLICPYISKNSHYYRSESNKVLKFRGGLRLFDVGEWLSSPDFPSVLKNFSCVKDPQAIFDNIWRYNINRCHYNLSITTRYNYRLLLDRTLRLSVLRSQYGF